MRFKRVDTIDKKDEKKSKISEARLKAINSKEGLKLKKMF